MHARYKTPAMPGRCKAPIIVMLRSANGAEEMVMHVCDWQGNDENRLSI